MDHDRATSEPRETTPAAGSILSAGVPTESGVSAAPVDWSAPGADGSGGHGPVTIGDGLVLAGVATRLAAFLVDGFILASASIAISLISTGAIADRSVADLVSAIVTAGLAIGYFAAFWIGPWAATPGQRLAAIRVVDDVTLLPIPIARAVVRSLVLGAALNLLSFAGPIGRVLGAIFIVWPFILAGSAIYDARHQGLHDRWTRTLVVRPAEVGSFPLTLGCFLIVLILLASPLIIAWTAGPAIEEWLRGLPAPASP